MRKRKLINKKINKLVAKCCIICKNSDTEVLENHRIIPGEKSGKYTKHNVATICPNCHAKVHKGSIKIIGWFDSTAGRVLIIEKDGKEILLKEAYS